MRRGRSLSRAMSHSHALARLVLVSAPAALRMAPIDLRLRLALVAFARRHVPERDAEDVVQTAIAAALESPSPPDDELGRRRWLFAIVRHKAMDWHRAHRRDRLGDPPVEPSEAPEGDAHALYEWARRELPEGDDVERTFQLMLREGDGEKLEHLALEENVPPARLRQRVSRLRRHFRQRWALAVGTLALLVVSAALLATRRAPEPVPIAKEDVAPPSPEERVAPVLRRAVEACARDQWDQCERAIDEARIIHPPSFESAEVRAMRAAIERGKPPPPRPKPAPPVRLTPAPDSTWPMERKDAVPSDPTSRPVPTTTPPSRRTSPTGSSI